MTSGPANFPDIQTHWAQAFIDALAQRRIVSGFPDGTFRPEQAVTRAEFAVMAQSSFPTLPFQRVYVPFKDVPANHWAAKAIQWAYERGLLTGYPDQTFKPSAAIVRVQSWVALVGGLGLGTSGTVPLATLYQDANQIPTWATTAVAAATEAAIVVNQPNPRQLRPNQPTTRAEVSVILYQCLVQLGQVGPIPSGAIGRWPVGSQTVLVNHPREFRAVWVAAVWNGDFPSKPGLTPQQQQAELIAILDQMQRLNFNALILQVRPEGDALYHSSLEPWSNWLTGTQGKPPTPFYDPLEFAIAQCHQRGMELHAWFNPYRARTARSTVNVAPHIAVTHPNVVYQWGNQLWMDPGANVVEDRTYAVILDVVRRYDVDGIHLDDYFYPYPIAGQEFPDGETYRAYQKGGGNLALADWRRDNVNRLIQRLRKGIRAEKAHVKFGISPFGIYRPGQPPPIQGLDAYNKLYADSLKWLQQGWVDYLAPQLYWRTDQPAQSYPVLLQWWVDSNTQKRHIYAGNNLSQLDGKAWTLTEIEKQVAITRSLNPQLALGNIFFSQDALAQNREGISDRFATSTFSTPALAPTINWLQVMPPTQPLNLRVTGNHLSWNTAPNLRGWAVYLKTENQAGTGLPVRWRLQRLLPAATTGLTLPAGTYAIAGVNRLAQESGGIVVTVSG
ncbi:MAG: family 10 glycosylhydrolase [Leptolyngbyaceae cyanobacterium]